MDKVKCGIDVLKEEMDILQGLKLGLITNYTGVDRDLNSTVDILKESSELICLFSPEHGVRGEFQAGAQVPDYIDRKTGVKVYSLYGDNRKPTKEMLKDIDVLVFDIQDVGARYYTYIYTMAYAMESAAELGKRFIVLDRPNPLGGIKLEGNILDTEFSSFVGMYPIPVRYGLTIGELAKLFNTEFNIGCDLKVMELEGWSRDMYFEDTNLEFIAPSPNIPTVDTALLYIGTCLFEGTNVSEGRGTTKPFELIGAPWMDGDKLAYELNSMNMEGVIFRPHYFTPVFSKYKGELCEGIQIHVRDRDAIEAFKIGISIIHNLVSNYEEFKFLEPSSSGGHPFFDLLSGTNKLREAIIADAVDDYLCSCEEELREFEKIRQKYIMY
ncbi:MAG TPA: DUF1343 domain-containing protein [Clostridiales bacterium]|nr:DUF1343 domain-containing protein [Clostridiales bacterium]